MAEIKMAEMPDDEAIRYAMETFGLSKELSTMLLSLERRKIGWVDLPRKAAVELAMKVFGFDEDDARFFVAMERGDVDGDVIEEEG
jgi:hypothetical protein